MKKLSIKIPILRTIGIIVSLILFTLSCEKQETEPVSKPLVRTAEPTESTITSSSGGGEIVSDGGSEITDRGVLWGLTGELRIDKNDGMTSDGSGSGIYTSQMTGLKPMTLYYARAYAINSAGTGYGMAVPFFPLPGAIDADGNEYLAVTIGTQLWLKENLKTTKLCDSTPIPYGVNLTTPCYSWYNNEISYKDIYGAHYNWHVVNTGKLCPEGWHVPSPEEWLLLANFCGGESIASAKLKTTSGWLNNGNGTDEFGFSAVAAGVIGGGLSSSAGDWGEWWSNSTNRGRLIFSSDSWFHLLSAPNEFGFSVRCLKD